VSSNVIPFPKYARNTPRVPPRRNPAFDALTELVINDRRRRGEIDPQQAAEFLAAIRAPL
jgi:hypothetical protein